MSERCRRIVTVLLALTLVVGLVPHGLRAADADATMVMAGISEMPMSGKCDGCGDDQDAMTSAACSAYCGSMVALPLIGPAFEPVSAQAFAGIAEPPFADRTIPPDPYPPRPAVLS
jgi:hypothetical protein